MAYLTQTNLENRLGVARVLALYDADNTGTINAAAMVEVWQTASDLVDATVARSFTGTLPVSGTAPVMMREAATLYAIALSFERKPGAARRLDETCPTRTRDRADKICEELATNLKKMVDAPPPTPGLNVSGGYTLSSAQQLTVIDGLPNTGDF